MKKFFIAVISLFLLLPISVFAKDKVKVYVFEAGGCPYCEAEIQYLEGLDSYNKKFEIVKKEAYIDHVKWENGKDYELAEKVAKAFKKAGFEDATHQATPFVVISDLYAAASYNTSLEDIINEAYEIGDKDIVKCIADGKDNCLNHLMNTSSTDTSSISNVDLLVIMLICTGAVIVTYILKSSKDKKDIIEALKSKK